MPSTLPGNVDRRFRRPDLRHSVDGAVAAGVAPEHALPLIDRAIVDNCCLCMGCPNGRRRPHVTIVPACGQDPRDSYCARWGSRMFAAGQSPRPIGARTGVAHNRDWCYLTVSLGLYCRGHVHRDARRRRKRTTCCCPLFYGFAAADRGGLCGEYVARGLPAAGVGEGPWLPSRARHSPSSLSGQCLIPVGARQQGFACRHSLRASRCSSVSFAWSVYWRRPQMGQSERPGWLRPAIALTTYAASMSS